MSYDITTLPSGDGGAKRIHKTVEMITPYTEAISAAATVGSFTIRAWAFTHTIVLTLPAWTNDVTATFSIENSNDDEIYSNAALARGTTHIMAVEKPLVGKNTVKITLSGVPGTGGGNTVTTFYLT